MRFRADAKAHAVVARADVKDTILHRLRLLGVRERDWVSHIDLARRTYSNLIKFRGKGKPQLAEQTVDREAIRLRRAFGTLRERNGKSKLFNARALTYLLDATKALASPADTASAFGWIKRADNALKEETIERKVITAKGSSTKVELAKFSDLRFRRFYKSGKKSAKDHLISEREWLASKTRGFV
ncbi:MAG: hypothetical protein MHM6MM_001183, partial [Cercozoa sp. M6MM]